MTKTREEYAAMVPDLAERENAARLFEAMKAAERALDEAEDPPETEQQRQALDALGEEHHKRRREINDWYDAEFAKIKGPSQLSDLKRMEQEATDAYNNAPGDAISEDLNDSPIRCALSGAPIYDTDETIDLGGKTILACLLLSQEQIAALTKDDEDEENIDEAA